MRFSAESFGSGHLQIARDEEFAERRKLKLASVRDKTEGGAVEADGVVVEHVIARAKDSAGEVGGGAAIVVNGHKLGGDIGDDRDVTGGVGFVEDGNDFVGNEGVAVGRIKQGSRASGGSAVW